MGLNDKQKCFYTENINCEPGHLDEAIKEALEKKWIKVKNHSKLKNLPKEEIYKRIIKMWDVIDEICEIKDCNNPATKITSTETKYIVVCDDCWHKRYKK